MITNIHNTYSQPLSFQAKMPKTRFASEIFNSKNDTVDKFAGKQSQSKHNIVGIKQAIGGILKNMFFETFPNLDPEYKNVSKNFSKPKLAKIKEKHTEQYLADNKPVNGRRGKTYVEADLSEYGIDNTGYGFGNTGNNGF